ncbi:endonuclease [Spirillospora sp. CA-294931]|uniref:endonuclease n=1 Tax=Spirillospora sp. CA-294931 TaxID=3240042 RepID=UPI003D89E92B
MDTVVKKLLHEAGQTFSEESDITLKDQPGALFRLLVLANLLSTRIASDIAMAAARELFAAGGGTARGMSKLTWQQRVDALGRGHYVRYDESTATRLGEMADLVQEKYNGDLRRLAIESNRDKDRAAELIKEFPGIGPTGVDIFFREAQAIWPWLRPHFDDLVLKGAERLDLPTKPDKLADEVQPKDLARLSSALVRVARDKKLADSLKD